MAIAPICIGNDRPDSRGERIADGVVHIVGISLSLFAVGMLLGLVISASDPKSITAAAIYGTGMIAMFSFSASYNMTLGGKAKAWLRRFDHSAIYLMIAGTYTPFTLVSLGGVIGYGLLALVWPVAAVGLTFKLIWPQKLERVSVAMYLALGWVGVLAAGAFVTAVPTTALVLLAVGGVLYSVGVIFHLWDSLPYQNAIWHGFVLAAAACHYGAVFQSLVLA